MRRVVRRRPRRVEMPPLEGWHRARRPGLLSEEEFQLRLSDHSYYYVHRWKIPSVPGQVEWGAGRSVPGDPGPQALGAEGLSDAASPRFRTPGAAWRAVGRAWARLREWRPDLELVPPRARR